MNLQSTSETSSANFTNLQTPLTDDEEDADSLPLLKEAENDEDQEPHKKVNWWHRSYKAPCWCRCPAAWTNGKCVLLTSILVLVFLGAVGFPLFYYVIVPTAIRRIVAQAPPIHLQLVHIQQIYSANQSIGLWVKGYFDLYGLECIFSPSVYAASFSIPPGAPHFSSLSAPSTVRSMYRPNNQPTLIPLGKLTLGTLHRTRSKPLQLDFFSIMYDLNMENAKQIVQLGAAQLESALSRRNGSGETTALGRRPDNRYKLNLDGLTTVRLFGLDFYDVRLRYNLPLGFTAQDIGMNFKPRPEPPYPDIRKTTWNVSMSITNPTSFAIDIGAINVTIQIMPNTIMNNTKPEPIAKVELPSFKIPFLEKSPDTRHKLSVYLHVFNLTLVNNLLEEWSLGADLSIAVRGEDIVLGGYPHAPHSALHHRRLEWLEELIKDVSLTIPLPIQHDTDEKRMYLAG